MRVTVVGLGHVGLVAAAAIADASHDVVGVDIDFKRISRLKDGNVPIYEPGLESLISKGLESGRLNFSLVNEFEADLGDAVVIAVGTPPLLNGAADLSQVRAAMCWVIEKAVAPTNVLMKSTVPPGTGRRLIDQCLTQANVNIAYVSNPEFLREGQAVQDWYHPDRIVIGGEDVYATEVAETLYREIDAPVIVTDITTAEVIKYTANAFLATKISFINEIANLCDRVGASIDDVAHGLSLDPRIGTSYLRPGLGYGGSCFPKDVRALEFLATMHDHSFGLLEAVIAVNNRQRLLPIQALKRALGSLQCKVITVLGLSFKPNTDDLREAPALDIIRFLIEDGAVVQAYDPKAVENARPLLPKEVRLASSAVAALQGAHAVVLATEWQEFINGIEWPQVFKIMSPPRFIFDGRNTLDSQQLKAIGFLYKGVGRS